MASGLKNVYHQVKYGCLLTVDNYKLSSLIGEKMRKIQLKSDLSQFVDREEETNTILNDIYDNVNSKIGIIAASTAIGKEVLYAS